jgi:uncharacterized protein YkwD
MTVGVARAADPNESPYAELESRLLAEVNSVRAQHHLIPLRRAPELDQVARSHSLDMAKRNYLSHHSPEGANPVDRISRTGLEGFTLAAENLGKTDRANPNREIVTGWLRSPDHRRNLLAPPFNQTGIGIARAADGSLLYTQVYITIPR